MAFAPDYATSKLFYVAYTNKKGDVEIDEYKRMAGDTKRADPTTRRPALIIPHRDGTTHNGGQLQFGKDGYLYIAVGDGGSLTPPKGGAARDLKKLLGKILRIDPKRKGTKPYTVPADNPYVGDPNKLPEIYAYGLRNPWRFSFDGANMMIADEGEDRQEEINILRTKTVKGTNFGWPQFEGRLPNFGPPGPDTAKRPMYVYDHDSTHCAVVGGYVARDPAIPALKGRYLFADLCGGKLMSMIPDVINQKATSVKPVGPTLPRITSFGIGPNNSIYLVQGIKDGKLMRLVPVP
jgi:glucose/arabinose dehydrogenase